MTPVPGVQPQIFSFTVRDEAVAKRVKDAEGKARRAPLQGETRRPQLVLRRHQLLHLRGPRPRPVARDRRTEAVDEAGGSDVSTGACSSSPP